MPPASCLLFSDNVIDSRGPGIRISHGAGSGVIRGNLIDARGKVPIEGREEGIVVEGNVDAHSRPEGG